VTMMVVMPFLRFGFGGEGGCDLLAMMMFVFKRYSSRECGLSCYLVVCSLGWCVGYMFRRDPLQEPNPILLFLI
jgi:hypothetical protein